MNSVHAILLLFAGFACGAVLGSFLSCVAYRLPRGYTLGGRSFCPLCNTQLKEAWNIPIVSFLALRGRSGCCGQPIPGRYFAFELGCAAVMTWIAVLTRSALVPFVIVLFFVVACAAASLFTPRHPLPIDAPGEGEGGEDDAEAKTQDEPAAGNPEE